MYDPYHGQVDIASVHLHVDLLVDHGLGVGVEVLAHLGHGHLGGWDGSVGLNYSGTVKLCTYVNVTDTDGRTDGSEYSNKNPHSEAHWLSREQM